MNKEILVVDFNGTSPTYTYYFSLALKKKGFNIRVLGNENKKDLRIHKQKLNFIGVKTQIKFLDYILNWILLIFTAKKVDVIHIQWLSLLNHIGFEVFLLRILKFRNPNIFYTVHNIYPHNKDSNRVKNRYNKVYHLIDNLVVHTFETKKKLLKISPNKNIIITNHGLFYIGFENNTERDGNIMVMLGMIYKYKGIEDAIDAANILKRQGHNFKFLIEGAGEKSYILYLKRKIDKLNLSEQVFIKEGYVDIKRLIELYNKASVTLMPYRKIEQSGVAYTSLGLEVPIVAYKIRGLKNVVEDRKTGRLVEKNNIDDFAASIKWVLKNKTQLRNNLKENKSNNVWNDSAEILLKHYFQNEF